MPDTPFSPPTAPLRRSRLRRVMAGMLGMLAALGTAGWWWSGSEGSLATSLRLTNALLPAGMVLHTANVQGSLRAGGRIGSAQWLQDGLALEVQGLDFRLDPALLLQGRLPVQQLHLNRLSGRSLPVRQPTPPLTEWVWPMKVNLAWQIDRVHWQAAAPVEASDLQGRYRFDGQQHQLALDRLQWAQGQYHGELTVQARAPMALQADLQGELHPPSAPAALPPLLAKLELQGPFSGPQARLAFTANLSNASHGPDAPALQLQGLIRPQAAQTLSELQARLQQIDLATLWPGAPHTRLDGKVMAHPEDGGWQLQVDLRNRLTGPWDRQRIPLEQLQAHLQQQPTGWRVHALQARWPGGGVQGQGSWLAPDWQGRWQIERLQPGQWLSSLQGPALSGQITAGSAGPQRVDMAIRLQPPSHEGTQASGLTAQLQWQSSTWTLPRLELHWADAHLQAQGQWTPAHQQVQAQVQWQVPGLTGRLDGHLSPRQGQGQWQLDAQDPAHLQAWLQRWPALGDIPAAWPWPLPGSLQASGQWQGGWASNGLQLQAGLTSPRLRLQTQATLALTGSAGAWLGQISQLQLDGTPAPATAARLVLQSPLAWQWLPQPGRLQWQPHRWSLAGAGSTASLQVEAGVWQSAGRTAGLPATRVQASMTDLPLQWAQWLGWKLPPGDVVLQGSVDLRLDERPKLLARLQRSRGDLQVSTELLQPGRVQAGLREARATLQVDGTQAALDLSWDSAQAGQLDARLQSQINPAAHDGLAALWPAAAPLTGQVNARLPRVGAWAWLAPPGWRVQGSLDARFDLAGTRAQPQWTGTLQADDLAVRSAVEGVEFRQGRLRARLQEQQIQLEEFRLLGAGAQGGEVSAQGLVRWLPQAGNTLQAVQMDLQMQARALRVTSRADRRLSVSGQVRAQLERGQMQVRGQLQADSALFILSDDTTPTLGKDVLVVRAQTQAPAALAPAGLSVMGTPDVQVQLKLGPDFQLRGQGLNTRLSGEVRLSSSAATGGQPRLVGQVQTEGGRYKAYGQALDIEQGLLAFSGPYDNPALDILALRPNLGQRVGVRVSGSAQTPRIRLYADPDMPDADKLAWLVLGRSPAAGGAESAVLQQAALALLGNNGKSLGGELASALGFDEVSLASRTTSTATGNTATGTAVTLGKRLSKDFYLAYESSVNGAFGSLFIFYDLSRKLALRAQTGEINALDLIWSIRHD